MAAPDLVRIDSHVAQERCPTGESNLRTLAHSQFIPVNGRPVTGRRKVRLCRQPLWVVATNRNDGRMIVG